jgi:CubicO group peptidase (beta-lactamase class C family)
MWLMYGLITITSVTQEDIDLTSPEYFPYAPPDVVGLSPTFGQNLQAFIDEHPLLQDNLNTIILLKDGYWVMQIYYNYTSYKMVQPMGNISLSLTASLVGMAHESGAIPSLNSTLKKWLPDDFGTACDYNEQTTLRQLLRMNPQGMWAYRRENEYWLNTVLQRATGQDLASYAQEVLFPKLRIDDWVWRTDANWACDERSGLLLSAWDLAMFGYWILREGNWQNEALLSPKWIQQMTSGQSNTVPFYGMGWWSDGNNDFSMFHAEGDCGTVLYIIKPYDMVLVITTNPVESSADDCTQQASLVKQLIYSQILTAVIVEKPN